MSYHSLTMSPAQRNLAPQLAASLIFLFIAAAPARAGELSLRGYVGARGVAVESQPSWLDGGFGRLAYGSDSSSGEEITGAAQLHLELDWQPFADDRGRSFGFFFHTTARAEPDIEEGRAAGMIEAFAHATLRARQSDVWRLRLGHFILPTSRENVELGWSSPYTLTFSALNSWIGEETRLTGLLSEYSLALGAIDELRFGASLFGGNDTNGALLAWRGWTMHDRLSVFGETLPLPPHRFLADGGSFEVQADRGTRPFGSDLDSRLGWASYVRWQRPGRAAVQFTHYDNRADRELYGDEYAWETDFDLLSAEVEVIPGFTLIGEWLRGSTGMGFAPGPYVQADIEASYLLASWQATAWRLSVRWDDFETVNRDGRLKYDDSGDGEAFTLAFFWEPNPAWRLGFEVLDVDAVRPAAAPVGFDSQVDGRSLILDGRYFFDWSR